MQLADRRSGLIYATGCVYLCAGSGFRIVVLLGAIAPISTPHCGSFQRFVSTAGEEIKLVNLRPSTRYVLHIGAKNAVGVGKSLEYSVTTDNVREYNTVRL